MPSLARHVLSGLLALCLSGCFVFGPVAIPIPLRRGGPPSATPPPIPTLELEYQGNRVPGAQTFFTWQTSHGTFNGHGGGLPVTLSVPVGASLNVIVNHPSPPAMLWITELDSAGVPVTSTPFDLVSTPMAYTPSQSGLFQLQVTAQWAAQNIVMYTFHLNVQP
jgi:hypothetical protein